MVMDCRGGARSDDRGLLAQGQGLSRIWQGLKANIRAVSGGNLSLPAWLSAQKYLNEKHNLCYVPGCSIHKLSGEVTTFLIRKNGREGRVLGSFTQLWLTSLLMVGSTFTQCGAACKLKQHPPPKNTKGRVWRDWLEIHVLVA